MKKIFLSFITVMLVLVLAAGCANNEVDPSSTGDKSREITVCENWGFEDGFHTIFTPSKNSNLGLGFYLINFYDTLVKIENGQIVPGLAESWSISGDGLVYTFNLKKNIKFSDGSDLNAAVVKRNLEMIPVILDDHNGSFGLVTTLFQQIVDVDEHTVEVHLTSPYYAALYDFATPMPMSIMAASAYTENNSLSEKLKTATLGTGPYMFESKADNLYSFVINPYYSGPKPDVEKFNVRVIPDNEAKALALRSGEVDLIFGFEKIGYGRFDEFAKDLDYNAKTSDAAIRTRLLGFNMAEQPVDDIRVRQSIAYALNKQELCDGLLYGIDGKADTALSQTLPYCDVDIEPYEFNLTKANSLLEEAGWVDNDGDGVREKNGQKLKLEFLYMTGSTTTDDIVLGIKSALEKIGMEIKVSGLELLAYYAETQQSKYTITYKETYGLPYDPFVFFGNMDSEYMVDNVLVQGFIHMENGNQLIRELTGMVNPQEIRDRYELILKELHDNVSFVPIAEMKELAVYNAEKIADYTFFGLTSNLNIAGIRLK